MRTVRADIVSAAMYILHMLQTYENGSNELKMKEERCSNFDNIYDKPVLI